MLYPHAASVSDAGVFALRRISLSISQPIALALLLTVFAPTTAIAQITLGSGDNQYTLKGGSQAGRDSSLIIDGGSGNDRLNIQGVSLNNPARLLRWESISLTQSAQLTLDSNLVFSGSEALPGQLLIEHNSALLLPHFSAAIDSSNNQALSVVNHGSIDMRGRSANRLSIQGDYFGGGNSRIHMDLVAGGDKSFSDRLIINGGHASGATELTFNRLAGSGAETSNGILVVETQNGGTTEERAFYSQGPVSAGPYDYFLYRGANDPGTADNWYLRSTLSPADGAADNTAGNAINAPVRSYRPEVPLYAQAKALARLTSLQEIGSYHKRRGEQRSWFDGYNDDWMRVHHLSANHNWRGNMNNRFDGDITGFQLGTNLRAGPTCTGGVRESGLFFGSTRASGDVTGFARGRNNYSAGRNQLSSHHLGYYFNDYRPNMGYFDFTAKVAYLELESYSHRGIGDTITGPQLTVSMEKGFTLPATEQFNLEPQFQTVVNYSNFSAYQDGISWVEPDMTPEVSFRAGLRIYNNVHGNTHNTSSATGNSWLNGALRYYLFGNLWHTLGGNDELLFDVKLQLDQERQATWGEFGAGIVLLEHKFGSAFLNLGYQQSLDDLDWSGSSANLGFNWAW